MVLDKYMIYQDLMRNLQNENSNKEYFFEVDVEYPKKLFGSNKDLLFLSERKK